jgi:hypothetical protein
MQTGQLNSKQKTKREERGVRPNSLKKLRLFHLKTGAFHRLKFVDD